MKVKVATIFYNYDEDETTIKMSDEYKGWYGLLMADVMQDAVYLVTKKYDESVEQFYNDMEKIRAKHGKERV